MGWSGDQLIASFSVTVGGVEVGGWWHCRGCGAWSDEALADDRLCAPCRQRRRVVTALLCLRGRPAGELAERCALG